MLFRSNATFEKGTRIAVELRLNEGSGFRRDPINLVSDCRLSDQRNFECDFEAPEVATIHDARITLQAHHPIRTALLYGRHRFFGQRTQEAAVARPVQTGQRMAAVVEPYPAPGDQDRVHQPEWPQRTVQPMQQASGSSAQTEERPWNIPSRADRPSDTGVSPPPRRRRLE